jgi:hypothetical protein
MSETKPMPVVEKVAELAMRLGQRHLADYGAVTSRHDFTQRQLLTCLILRVYLKTTYRGLLDLLATSPGLRAQIGLTDKRPHFTTLYKFSRRSEVLTIAQKLVAAIGQSAGNKETEVGAAMDATGLSRTPVSDYFTSRRGRKFRRWVKVGVVILTGSLLPVALAVDLQPTHDCVQARTLLAQAQAVSQPAKLYADAGYDAEWIHVRCREHWGVASVIPTNPRRVGGSPRRGLAGPDDPGLSGPAGLPPTLEGGKLLQRPQTHDEFHLECAPTQTTGRRSRFESPRLRPPPLGKPSPHRMVSTEQVQC